MKTSGILAALVAAAVGCGSAAAQTVGLGTTQGGVVPQLSAAIAKQVSEKTDVRMRTQGMASTGQYAPRVNAGQLEFGIANIIETTFAYEGKEIFEGRPNPNLRMAFVLFSFPVAFFVNDSSDIRTFADLKGRRVPAGWTSQRLGEYLFRGFFANVGMSYDDVEKVTLAAMPRMWEEFVQGNVDVAFGTFGGSQVQEIETRVNGIRYLQLNSDPEAVKVMEAILPSAYVTQKPTKSGEMVNVMEFDFVVFTGAHVPDDVVYKTVSAIHGGKADLVATSGLWNALNPSAMAKKVKVPFHPGAEKFYREQGILPAQN